MRKLLSLFVAVLAGCAQLGQQVGTSVTIPAQTITIPQDPAIPAQAAQIAALDARVTKLENGTTPVPPDPPATVRAVFKPDATTDFPNPDRGFYGWSGNDFVNRFDQGSVQDAKNKGMRLVMAKLLLSSYRTQDLPASYLETLGQRFATVRGLGMKVSLWASYDDTSSGNDTSAAWIKKHLEQLRPVLAANADVIPVMRAGFIGAWGEWHSSKNGNSCGYNSGSTPCSEADANRITVRDALFANVPASTQIGFRYPDDLIKWYPSATQQVRAGGHNDCFLAGSDDSGTYDNQSQRTYMQTLSGSTAWGGETCQNAGSPLRDSCDDIIREGAQYHLSWLNSSYAPAFLDKWKADGCYTTVSRSMGYRVQLDELAHPAEITRGADASVSVALRNVGWGRVFGARKLVLVLKHSTSGALVPLPLFDLGALESQAKATTTKTQTVRVPTSAATGSYAVFLAAPDALNDSTAFYARFANANDGGQSWDAGAAMFKTGTAVTVK